MTSRLAAPVTGIALLGSLSLAAGTPALPTIAHAGAASHGPLTAQLAPMRGSSVHGNLTLVAVTGGTRLTLHVSNVAPGLRLVSTLHAGTCKLPSASTRTLATLQAGTTGVATAVATVRFPLSLLADGEHIVDLRRWDAKTASFKAVACGPIPTAH